jgi:hypothetical protein
MHNTAATKTITYIVSGELVAPSPRWSTPPPLRVPPPPLFPFGFVDNGRCGSADAMSFGNQLRLEKGWSAVRATTGGWRRVSSCVGSKVAAPLVLLHSGLAVLVVLHRSIASHPPRHHACSGARCVQRKRKIDSNEPV